MATNANEPNCYRKTVQMKTSLSPKISLKNQENVKLKMMCILLKSLKWYYDENYKQVVCMRRKMLFTVIKYLFSFQRKKQKSKKQ